jgi:hypothetical protein
MAWVYQIRARQNFVEAGAQNAVEDALSDNFEYA